ncbi:MAG: RtcB family protein [Candidatus Aminicenantes bacterium]
MDINVKKINDYTWEIPKQGEMKVPTVLYASSKLLESIKNDLTLRQARNVACLNGIQRKAYVMPDAHQGYGFPIGGVAAFDLDQGVISPGGVGYDINCGVRLLRSDYAEQDIYAQRKQLLVEIFKEVPAGVGKGGTTRLTRSGLEEVCMKGAEWAVENGYGMKADLQRTEEYGRMKTADTSFLSKRALERGVPQLGTLGAGNHFLEIQKVDEIFDSQVAKVFGIGKEGQIMVMIHCGSRGLGHQVASDFIRSMENKFGTKGLPDRELINAPIHSPLGQEYYKSMSAAVNFAFANRQMIAHWVRSVFAKIMGSSEGMDQVYDVCHNVAKFEKHSINGRIKEVCVHRKGATRSFGSGREEIPEVYRSVGQPVLIPGSMGTASYVLVGTKQAEEISFGSTAHGAGRVMSRRAALRRFRGEKIKKELENKGVELQFTGWKGVAEEASGAYKDVDEVVKVSHEVGIGKLVARLVPVGVMKG